MLNQEPLNETAVLRDYLFALRDGRKPAQRPEISERWLEPVKALEQFYEEAKGSARIMAGSLDILKRFYPELERILAEPSEQARQEEDLGELAELPAQARLSPDLSRGACRFLDLYEQYSKLASPEGFEDAHTMCGFWLLSTVAARRVYLHTGSKFFYTNLLIVVCARTTLFAKTETARVAKQVLQAAGLSFLLAPDKSTPQKFTSDLAGLIVPPDYGELSPKRQEQIKRRLALPPYILQSFDEDVAGDEGALYWLRRLPRALRWSPSLWKDANALLQSQPNGICTLREWVIAGMQAAEIEFA